VGAARISYLGRTGFRSSDVVSEEGLAPVRSNIHAHKVGYQQIADTFEAVTGR